MHPKSPKWLEDTFPSCRYIEEDITGVTLEGYLKDRRLRQGLRQVVERNLGDDGEALNRPRTVDPGTISQITDAHKIIGLRNRLARGYDDEIDSTLVWQAVQDALPRLHAETVALLPPFE